MKRKLQNEGIVDSDEFLLARGVDIAAPVNLRLIMNAKALRLFESLLQQAFVYDRVLDARVG